MYRIRRGAAHAMVTPDFISDENGEFIFVANHNLEIGANIARSIAFNRARVAHAFDHLPKHLSTCRVVYDVRGQTLSASVLTMVRLSLNDVCRVEFRR